MKHRATRHIFYGTWKNSELLSEIRIVMKFIMFIKIFIEQIKLIDKASPMEDDIRIRSVFKFYCILPFWNVLNHV